MAKILLIEDCSRQRALFTDVLVDDGHEVVGVRGGRAGITAVKSDTYDLVVFDIGMPDIYLLPLTQPELE